MQIPLDDHILLLAQCLCHDVDATVICILPVHPFPGKPVITWIQCKSRNQFGLYFFWSKSWCFCCCAYNLLCAYTRWNILSSQNSSNSSNSLSCTSSAASSDHRIRKKRVIVRQILPVGCARYSIPGSIGHMDRVNKHVNNGPGNLWKDKFRSAAFMFVFLQPTM